MLGGGLDPGTSTLITGNAGVGKTTLGISFLEAAARPGSEGGPLHVRRGGRGDPMFRCRRSAWT